MKVQFVKSFWLKLLIWHRYRFTKRRYVINFDEYIEKELANGVVMRLQNSLSLGNKRNVIALYGYSLSFIYLTFTFYNVLKHKLFCKALSVESQRIQVFGIVQLELKTFLDY